MTGLLLFAALIVLLVVALEVTHRRAGRGWRPGLDTRSDRDAARLADELRALDGADPGPGAPVEQIHLVPPRSAATDARLITRVAA